MERVLSRQLVGRRRETEAASRALDTAGDDGTVLVLVGEPGIGKSRLRRVVEGLATDRGWRVLSGRAVQEFAAEPFRPLTEALTTTFRETGPPRDPELLPSLPTLAHVLPGWSERRVPTVSVLAIAEALLRLLSVTGAGGRTLLAVEDVQWADADTVAILEYLATHRSGHGLSLVVTARSDPSLALDVSRRLATERVATVLEVGPLPDDDVDALVRSCLAVDAVSSELLAFIRERADGVPFLVEELLAGLVRTGGLIRRDEGWQVVGSRLTASVPATLADSVAARMRDLRLRSQEICYAAALLGRQFDVDLLVRVTGEPEDVVLAALREATYAQLLDPGTVAGPGSRTVRFRHALTREHVIARMLAPERARLAAEAVAAIEQAHPGLPGGWLDLAAELARLAGDLPRAVAHLTAAGDRARRRGALATASARLETARGLADGDEPAALGVEERLAQVRALAGEVDEAVRLGQHAIRARRERGDRSGAEIELQLTLARAAVTAGDPGGARLRAGDAARRSGELEMAEHRARARALEAHAALEAGDIAAAARLAEDVLAAAPGGEARCEALEVRGRVARLHDLAAAEAAFVAELETAQEHQLAVWRARALHELGTIDLLESMRTDRLEAARRAAIEAGVPATAAVVDFHLASALVGRGEAARAREVVERAVAAARRLSLAILPFALVVLARTYAHERRREEMERALAEAGAAAPDDPTVEAAAWGHARAMLALHEADREGARAALDRTAALLAERPDQHFPYWGLWALLRTVDDHDGASARRFAAGAGGRDTTFNRALLDAAVAVQGGREAGRADAGRSFTEALAQLDGYQGADWLRHLLRWVAAPAALTGGWGEPVTWLQTAVGWFADHGYEPLASSCRGLLRDAGAPVPRRGRGNSTVPDPLRAMGVTSREMDVLRLVALGLTDRQVAERLVLSPKTVEKHVSRLLDKTGAEHRSALAALLASG